MNIQINFYFSARETRDQFTLNKIVAPAPTFLHFFLVARHQFVPFFLEMQKMMLIERVKKQKNVKNTAVPTSEGIFVKKTNNCQIFIALWHNSVTCK